MAEPDLLPALVRILADAERPPRVLGAGFLVSTQHVLTCAHVVADALRLPRSTSAAPSEPVWLDFPLLEGTTPVSARVVVWHPVREHITLGEVEDIAVLELDAHRPLLQAAQPVPLVVLKPNAFFERPVRVCGFPEGMDTGDYVTGQLQGPLANGWIQLDHALGRRGVAPGFSGTVVWDKQEKAVIGMIVSTQARAGDVAAYLIPVAMLIRAWPALDSHSRPPNPYRGLDAFREQDAPYFYGRDRDIDDVLAAVQKHPLVAIVGASGSGKSSLVFAGLVPRLRKAEQWLIASFRPRSTPFEEFATAFAPLLFPEMDKLARQEQRNQLIQKLTAGTLSLTDPVEMLVREHPGQRLLLVADQFEELYTQAIPSDRQRRFIEGLLAAVQTQPQPPAFTLLLTLRADFLGQAVSDGPFANALDRYPKKILGPLGSAELQAAIEGPAQALGVTLEAGLTERILNDLGDEPGALPLLEFALTQLWEQQRYRQLTHAAYEAIGGVTEALTRHADAVYERLKDHPDRLRRIFVQLVRPGEGTEDTRQVATREQVGSDHWSLVTELADARLVVTGRDAQGQETVEVIHEALIRHWRPLRQWIAQERRFRLWQNRLRLDLQEWERQHQDSGALLRGARLAEAEERLKHQAADLSPAERTYIEASLALRD